MTLLPFKKSALASIGIELEYQIVSPKTFELTSRSKELIRQISQGEYQTRIKPEITQSMIEINSSVHSTVNELYDELVLIRNYLSQQAQDMQVLICGGGTHPFQKWTLQKVYPSMRYKNLASKFRYLAKRATVFGQHIHIGCESGDDAIYLTHALARYTPHFLAICASSPFYQNTDTGFYSARSTIFNSFPLSGVVPFIHTWEEFAAYFYKMKDFGIATSMKDYYWDIRPKPEFGTAEIRVCDTPLTIQKAAMIAAYVQALSVYLLTERPLKLSEDLYYLYNYNRFQSSRYAFTGDLIDFETAEKTFINEDILRTIKKIEPYANRLNSMGYISLLLNSVINKETDTDYLRT